MCGFRSSSTTTLPTYMAFLIEMKALSSSTAFRRLFQLSVGNVSCFPASQANSDVTFATFLLPFSSFLASGLGQLSLSSTIRSFFTLSVVEVLLYAPNWDPFFHSIHLWLLFPCTMPALRVQMFFRTLLRTLPRHLFLLPCRSPMVHSCQFSSPSMRNVMTLSMMMFSSAMSNSSYGNVVPRNRVFSELSGITFFTAKNLLFVSNIPKPSFVLVRLVEEVHEDVIEVLHLLHDHVR